MKSKRLNTIASFINKEDIVADIGSDHGHLPLYLAKQGHTFIYANENKKAPFNRLKTAVQAQKLENIITTELSDGLKTLPKQINTVVIAGMGGNLIADIITANPDKLDNVSKLILAPNNHEQDLRQVLSFSGFTIVDEVVIEEAGQFYEIIIAHNRPCKVCGVETMFGPQNLIIKSPTFVAKWQAVYEQNEQLLSSEKLSPERERELEVEQAQIKSAITKR